MSEITIYYFTGTGNTGLAADMIARRFGETGASVETHRVRRPLAAIPVPAEDCKLVGIGYPIHAFNSPRIMLHFVRQLPAAQGTRVFFFKTAGEPFHLNDASSWMLYRELKKKGYAPIYELHMLMPYYIMFRYRDALAKQMYMYTEAMARMLVMDVTAGADRQLKYPLHRRALSCTFRIQQFGAWINGPMIGAKKSKCVKCGACAAGCPGGNITMTDKGPKFGWNCTMCMHCAAFCPKDAINPGFLTPWKVNGKYDYAKFMADDSIAPNYVNADTKGYFKLFRKYYNEMDARLAEHGIVSPRG